MKISILLTISIIVILSNESIAGRLKRLSGNEFILHSCTASALLIRKHRNEEGVKKFHTSPLLRRFNDLRKRNTNTSSQVNMKPSARIEQLMDVRNRNNNMQRRHFGAKNLKETPLATIDVDLIHKDTPIFKRKNPLPILERNISGRKIKEPANVIVIKPVINKSST